MYGNRKGEESREMGMTDNNIFSAKKHIIVLNLQWNIIDQQVQEYISQKTCIGGKDEEYSDERNK